MTSKHGKLDIVDAALASGIPARIPFTCWYHFGLQHASGEEAAAAEIEFFKRYDLDFLKVMDDFGFPFPDGFEWFRGPADYRKLKGVKNVRDFDGYKRQLRCLEIIADELDGETHFINTVFSPFTWLRNFGWLTWQETMREHTGAFLEAMEVATENIRKYVKAQVETGISGIFYSQPAADPEFTSTEEFETLIKPYDLRIFEEAKNLPFNVLHAHGCGLYIEAFFDYPVQAVNYSDRHVSNPSLDGLRKQKPDWCLMGGINEELAKESDPRSIEAEVQDAYRQTEGRGWICAPGCSLKTNIWESHIRTMRDAARALPL